LQVRRCLDILAAQVGCRQSGDRDRD